MSNNEIILTTMREWVRAIMHNSFHASMRFSRELGWSVTQLQTLMIIHKTGPRAISDIGEELSISNAAASQLLDRMVQEELILRSEDPADRRVKLISLTEKGEQVVQKHFAAQERWMHEVANNLSDEEKDEIVRALNILIEKSKQYGHSPDNECHAKKH